MNLKIKLFLDTWLQQPPRRLWTWKSPGERYKNQIDDITMNSRIKRSVTHAKTYPGADCGLDCDHVPLVAVMKVKLKKVKKRKKCKVRREWKDLNGEKLRRNYLIDVKIRYEILGKDVSEDEEEGVESEWKNLQKTLVETAKNVLPEKAEMTKQPWMKQDILNLMDERRKWKRSTIICVS